jgi:hypothetical protein
MNPPYVEVIYEERRYPEKVDVDICYRYVQVVRAGEEPVKYDRTGEFEGDLAEAWADGLPLLPNLQNHDSVELYRKLVKAKPNERYAILPGAGKTTPLIRS